MSLGQNLGRIVRFGPPISPRKLKSSPNRKQPRLLLEALEERTLLSVTLQGIPNWAEQGPGPMFNGNNVEGIPNRPQAGAINQIAVDPANADRIFVATSDGGIWRTTNGTNA